MMLYVEHDPSKVPAFQPVLPKKAPPTTGRGRRAWFYSDKEPPRIGSEQVQPAPPPKLPGSTPTTPAHPPRPPISALPQPVQESSNQATLKHPLPQPAQQGPPNKQVRHKAFPADQQINPTTSMAAPSAVDMSRMRAPSPKGPPASFLPTPENVQQMDLSAAAAALPGERRKFYKIRSASDINWSRPLKEQLEPNLTGGPDKTKTFDELCMLRSNIPKLDDHGFQLIYPSDNIICITQKTGARHFIHMREAAAWVINGTHWFSILKQPMMIVIWCRDWEEASKFQYLTQVLQVTLGDYIPRYHIFVQQEEEVDKLVQHWMQPTTLWDGNPVIGFMADSYLDDLETVGFKHFNPMWTFPTTSVNQNWEPMTFGMAPWHIIEATERSKDALVSQSPIVVFKSCNMQALGIAYSRIVLPSTDSKGETKGKTYCPATWNYAYQWQYAAEYADLLRQAGASSLLCQECILSVIAQLSNKSSSHPNCAFADSASTVMNGVMVSLTPCIKASADRPIALNEYAEFKDVNDMVHKLNAILSIPAGFPQIPAPRKDCRSMQFPPDKRNAQYVMCPEQECESLVYYGDQSRSVIDVLGLGQDPFWDDRVKVLLWMVFQISI